MRHALTSILSPVCRTLEWRPLQPSAIKMTLDLAHLGATRLGATVTAAFLASTVECVEALTVVLAVGSVRGWRSTLSGAAAALGLLAAIVAALGPALSHIPLGLIQLAVGIMILLFGLRWLRKAILRSAGLIPLHDEQAAFVKNTAAAFNITMLEGTEVVFIVIALGAGGTGLLLPAALGAFAALLVVSALGLMLHRPLARIPENTLKFVVGVLLSAFGTFWIAEGAGLHWPGPAATNPDLAIPCLIVAYLAIALWLIPACRAIPRHGPVEN
jgi:uncharacterized membrane protein